MSEVISFRLNKDNLREAKALLVLQEWRIKGYSVRQTITEALVSLDRNEHKSDSSIDELNEVLNQVNHLLRHIESGGSSIINDKAKSNPNNNLSPSFVASVKKSARSGLKID